jgi:hypothetical protein
MESLYLCRHTKQVFFFGKLLEKLDKNTSETRMPSSCIRDETTGSSVTDKSKTRAGTTDVLFCIGFVSPRL